MEKEHSEPERKDISEEGEFEESNNYGNILDEDGGYGLYGNARNMLGD